MSPVFTAYFVRDERFDYVGSVEFTMRGEPDFFLATERYNCHHSLPGRVVHAVRRQGVPLLHIIEVERVELTRRPAEVERPR